MNRAQEIYCCINVREIAARIADSFGYDEACESLNPRYQVSFLPRTIERLLSDTGNRIVLAYPESYWSSDGVLPDFTIPLQIGASGIYIHLASPRETSFIGMDIAARLFQSSNGSNFSNMKNWIREAMGRYGSYYLEQLCTQANPVDLYTHFILTALTNYSRDGGKSTPINALDRNRESRPQTVLQLKNETTHINIEMRSVLTDTMHFDVNHYLPLESKHDRVRRIRENVDELHDPEDDDLEHLCPF